MNAAANGRDAVMHVRVDCQAGYRGEPEPAAFWFGDRRVVVDAIIDRWYARSQRWFKVEADDGDTYILRHDESSDAWALAAFTSAASPGTHPELPIAGASEPH